ncbi:hypothetical protein CHS0354_022764 [Potamilus streckersoni]|uniref:Protein phosphatase 1 regulatory subunit 12B n=1 Tax=Potamilus streckersoni TaxID=2493646 RepID=A0AAE0RT36_9BIVA|nr:hypothetical protein CHS0354_022764 [Potamilus streckersoni]
MADEKQPSALIRRHEQIKRWENSDTFKEPTHPKETTRKVKFQDGCVFLAACSSGDRNEVKRLLDRGADINTANVDGLTALHQACIDDNLDMVEFLVDNGADVNACDNEGWTALHATASCGFTEIARYLLEMGASVSAVNNDGDLPMDICEDDEMEKLLQDEMDRQGVDADAARREEEEQMLRDANQWLNSKVIHEKQHPKTGASALHVAAAKGYIKVINILLQAGVDVNAKDYDDWTPLHAAAHWGQEEVCKLLAEHMCDFDTKNKAGQTAFDVADTDMIKLLEELKLKQASLKDQQKDMQKEIIQIRGPSSRRRSSVTRMSVEQKQNVILKTNEQERATLNLLKLDEGEKSKSSSSSGSEEEEEDIEESSESETEKQNEINKQTSNINQPRDRDKPPIMATVEIRQHDMPRIEETSESPEKEHIKILNGEENDKGITNQTPALIDHTLFKPQENIDNEKDSKDIEKQKEKEKEKDEKEEKETEKIKAKEKYLDIRKDLIEEKTKEEKKEGKEKQNDTNKVPPPKQPLTKASSVPTVLTSTQVPKVTLNSYPFDADNDHIPSWRSGLRKTGSTSQVIESLNKANETSDTNNLPRSASSPRITDDTDKNEKPEDNTVSKRPALESVSSSITADANQNRNADSSSSYQSAYVPYYRRQMEQNDRKEQERITAASTPTISNRISAPASLAMTIGSSVVTATTVNAVSSPSTPTTPISGTSSLPGYGRFFEPPKRDEEAELQRKSRAKKARQTRRSTQGVTLEEIKQAEQELKRTDVVDGEKKNESEKSQDSERTKTYSESEKSEQDVQNSSVRDRTLNSSVDSLKSDSSEETLARWRSNRVDRNEFLRNSFRKPRDIDLSASAPSSTFYNPTPTDNPSSTYIPRSQRNALAPTDISSSLGPIVNLTRSTSLRTPRRPEEPEESKDDSRKEKSEKEERRESTALRARRARKERRSTGINSLTGTVADENDKNTESKEEEKKEDKNTDSDERSLGRYIRPSSYAGYSKSTPSLEVDYKKLYEDEKLGNERLCRELDQCKKELGDAKKELDRLMKRNEQTRITADTNDRREKRALERKLSEMEEELKLMEKLKAENSKLKEENRALTRVVAKLSK